MHASINYTIIGSDNDLSPGRRQAIKWNNIGLLSIGPFETKFSEIRIKMRRFSLKKINMKMSSAKWRPFCLGLNVLYNELIDDICECVCLKERLDILISRRYVNMAQLSDAYMHVSCLSELIIIL